MSVLKGITWDHPRGYQPLKMISKTWISKGIDISWDIRSLKDFGDHPIDELIPNYDFIVLDHPYMGEAAGNNLLVPLDKYLDESFLVEQKSQSVGPSFESYRYDGHMWALPIDAAAQVAVFRKDLVDRINWELPTDVVQLHQAASLLPGKYRIAVPLCPTDMWCVFLTLCAQYADGNVFCEEGVNMDCGLWALEQIFSWQDFLFEGSFHLNPVQMLELMATEDNIVYSPFAFGYTNYSRAGFSENLLHFGNAPKSGFSGISTVLGGAGLAISTQTAHLPECLDFLKYILSEKVQAGAYYANGGQPGCLAAWTDGGNDKNCGSFFSKTIKTMEHAYMRPRHKGFNRFQESAAESLHSSIVQHQSPKDIIKTLNRLYTSILNESFQKY